ncbi:Lymphoid-specific helicase [Zancudomyces culisetae]|uniref:Lymphoid-specific helicase n=1 Tax=Zancudomyces culisetae TaxID=1213189 RepID=A0A1R1PXG8_ZANCU|nr:Lymphoid-specific helicase [Zancudomyces culisetae]|eukprot:OMH85680.1 Lymphoid-specific helicase [Zancudomyces culisetae]
MLSGTNVDEKPQENESVELKSNGQVALKELKEKAMADYNTEVVDKQKAQRLNFLLERSTLYANFLAKKLERQKEEKRKKDAKREKKTEKRKEMETAVQTTTRSSSRLKKKESENSSVGQIASPQKPKNLKTNGTRKTMKDYFGSSTKGMAEDGSQVQEIEEVQVGQDEQGDVGNGENSENDEEYEEGLIRQPRGIVGKMKKYQLEGLEWLVSLYENGLNGILADEMGLGKETGFQNGIDLAHQHQCCCIMEPKKNGTESAKSANRLLLTGTPLQNKLSELWSLLNFLLPDIFDNLDEFEEWFDFDDINEQSGKERILGEEASNKIITKLHHILQPFLLRRLKSDVELELPPKREYIIRCPITNIQKEYYQAVLSNRIKELLMERANGANATGSVLNGTHINDGHVNGNGKRAASRAAAKRIVKSKKLDDANNSSEDELFYQNGFDLSTSKNETQNVEPVKNTVSKARINNLKLMHIVMQLRKVCDHPYLFDFPLIDPEDPQSDYLVDEALVRSSGKLLMLDVLLPHLFKHGHRVLIFSQMSKMIDIVEMYVGFRNWKFCRIDGSVKHDERLLQINSFNSDPSIGVFLLTTRAGGLGINLATADTVILLDSDWNPQMDLQAMDRVHRIGQTKPVLVYRFTTAGTVEEDILNKASSKRKLEKIVIHQNKFKGISQLNTSNYYNQLEGNSPFSISDLDSILNSSTFSTVSDQQATVSDKIASVPLSEKLPKDLVISASELQALTDRSNLAANDTY